nr:hypothetical protein [Acrocarpospora macrocephala]
MGQKQARRHAGERGADVERPVQQAECFGAQVGGDGFGDQGSGGGLVDVGAHAEGGRERHHCRDIPGESDEEQAGRGGQQAGDQGGSVAETVGQEAA